jgi:CubicO group peptidase (beta-lactamase class C family)
MSAHRALSTLILLGAALLTACEPAPAGADPEPFDLYRSSREAIALGGQALGICNGRFVSDRTLDQIYEGELAAMGGAPAPPERVEVDEDERRVTVRPAPGNQAPSMRAAYRPGLGCVVLSPEQGFDAMDELPSLDLPPLDGDPAHIPWPTGDLVEEGPLPDGVDGAALEAAGQWAFDREGHGGHPGQRTLSVLVVHDGRIVYERYAPGVDMQTRTRTWSAAKSLAATLVGMAVDEGHLELDAPLPFEWVPDELAEYQRRYAADFPMIPLEEWPPTGYDRAPDPREGITLRHVLHMSSGLYPVDNDFAQSVGSSLSYFAGSDAAYDARNRGLVREPGTVWDYENHDTLLAVLALRHALADDDRYLEYPRRALLDRIGMRSTVPGVDRFGNFIMSSQVYTNARDLARLGLLHLNRGVWDGERILSEDWVDFVRTPAPSTREFGRFYGGQWWLVPDARTDLPRDAYTAAGARGQFVIVVPSHDLVVVRRGLDRGAPGFSVWDLLHQILPAFPEGEGGSKP